MTLIQDSDLKKSKTKQFDVNSLEAVKKTSADRWNTGNGETPNKLKLACWNVNGIRAVLKKG